MLQFLRVKLKLHCWFLLRRFGPESFLLLLVSSWSCSTGNVAAAPNDQLLFKQLFQTRISYQRRVINEDNVLQPVESGVFTTGHTGNEPLAPQQLLVGHEIARTTGGGRSRAWTASCQAAPDGARPPLSELTRTGGVTSLLPTSTQLNANS